MQLAKKMHRLKSILRKMPACIVAYSGGLDSSFLLKNCVDVLGKDNVLAVSAKAAIHPDDQLKQAKKIAEGLGVRHLVIKTNQLKNRFFLANSKNRCYYCKLELFKRLKRIARLKKIKYVLDASHISDMLDFRPGNQAIERLKIYSPLKEAGLNKKEIRILSKNMHLSDWKQPSFSCLAASIPYGEKITREKLKRIEKARKILRNLGFRQVRLRSHQDIARIEVEKKDIFTCLRRLNAKIIRRLKNLGYTYIALDLEGYRSGSLNEVLKIHG